MLLRSSSRKDNFHQREGCLLLTQKQNKDTQNHFITQTTLDINFLEEILPLECQGDCYNQLADIGNYNDLLANRIFRSVSNMFQKYLINRFRIFFWLFFRAREEILKSHGISQKVFCREREEEGESINDASRRVLITGWLVSSQQKLRRHIPVFTLSSVNSRTRQLVKDLTFFTA